MIWQKEALDLNYSEIAVNLGVDCTTVWRAVKMFRTTGDVKKKAYPSIARKLTPVTKYIIANETLKRPGITLREIQTHLLVSIGTEVSLSTIYRFLKSIGFTR